MNELKQETAHTLARIISLEVLEMAVRFAQDMEKERRSKDVNRDV